MQNWRGWQILGIKRQQLLLPLLSLMGKVRNIFAVEVGRYKKKAPNQRLAFAAAKAIWLEAALELLHA